METINIDKLVTILNLLSESLKEYKDNDDNLKKRISELEGKVKELSDNQIKKITIIRR